MANTVLKNLKNFNDYMSLFVLTEIYNFIHQFVLFREAVNQRLKA